MSQMHKVLLLINWEISLQNRVNNLTKYIFAFLFFCTCSITLINSYSDINRFGIIFTIIALPLGLLSFANLLFKNDIDDGYLENLLSNFSSSQIVIAKLSTLFICSMAGVCLNLPIIWLFFNLNFEVLITLSIILLLLLFISTSLLVLIASIQGYFRSNTNFLSILVTPLLIPSIILAGLALQSENNTHILLIMLGIDMIFIPITVLLSSSLIKDIYNI